MKKSTSRFSLFSIVVCLILSCQGKQGDPGPAGMNGTNGTNGTNGVNGTNAGLKDDGFKAVVSGTLSDGTPYTDSLTFDYCNGYEIYSFPGTNEMAVNLYRSQFPINNTPTELNPRLSFGLKIVDLGSSSQMVSLLNPSIDFMYAKPLGQWEILDVVCQWIDFDPTYIKFPIDPASSTFNFTFTQPNAFLSGTDSAFFGYVNGLYYASRIPFYTTTNDTVYYSNPLLGGTNSGAFIKLIDQNGNVSTSSPVYSSIHLVNHYDFTPSWVEYFTFADTNNKDLSKTITVAPDSFSVSNLSYAGSTAILSFNFALKKNVYRNGSNNPIGITGSFSGHVYVIKD